MNDSKTNSMKNNTLVKHESKTQINQACRLFHKA
jgi:hypothetical protein